MMRINQGRHKRSEFICCLLMGLSMRISKIVGVAVRMEKDEVYHIRMPEEDDAGREMVSASEERRMQDLSIARV
jgi:hypothetical protein